MNEFFAMGMLVAKVVSIFLLGSISLLVGLLPLVLQWYCGFSTGGRDQIAGKKNKFMMSAINCFGGGVILTTCFIYMLPEVNQLLEKNIKHGAFPDTGKMTIQVHHLFG